MGKNQVILGFDIGGTGIKSALVDVDSGKLVTPREKVLTPQPSNTKSVGKVIKQVVKSYGYVGPVGCGFPAIIHHGVAKSAANIDDSWVNVNLEKFFEKETGLPFYAANDADVAGLAEVRFGKVRKKGTVIVLTIGTGIGSGIFLDGKLVPNSELGHLYYKDSIYEHYISNSARKRAELSWEDWAPGFSDFLRHLEKLFSPDLFVLGGGASSKFDRFGHLLHIDTKVVPARYQNDAGVLGAALYADSCRK